MKVKPTDEKDEVEYYTSNDESLNEIRVNEGKFSSDGHSWNGKPMINIWENM